MFKFETASKETRFENVVEPNKRVGPEISRNKVMVNGPYPTLNLIKWCRWTKFHFTSFIHSNIHYFICVWKIILIWHNIGFLVWPNIML